MDDPNELALQAFELIDQAKKQLKADLETGGMGDIYAILEDLLQLQSMAIQVSYQQRIHTEFFKIRLERVQKYLKRG